MVQKRYKHCVCVRVSYRVGGSNSMLFKRLIGLENSFFGSFSTLAAFVRNVDTALASDYISVDPRVS